MLNDLKSVFVSKQNTIFDVMKAIDKTGSRFALVVGPDEKLEGIVTDGDIRRGFIDGFNGQDTVEQIMNKSPIVAKEGLSNDDMLALVTEKYKQIPVTSENGKIRGIITYNDKSVLVDVKSKSICVLGMGFVGLTFSLILAELGFKVYGFDIDEEKINTIAKKECPFHEDGLDSYLNRYVGRNFFPVDTIPEGDADIYIITVGTPINLEDKKPRISYVEKAAKSIAKVLKYGDLVILRSTVPVGTTRNVVLPIFDTHSGLKAGRDYYLAFAPERTIAGQAMPELKKLPQVIGGFDKKSALLTDRLFREITSTIIDTGTLEGAEMVKIMNNTFRDVKFAYANEMALICKDMGLDAVKLIQAANQEYIRDQIPLPSPGVGGACLTKDPYILMYSCEQIFHKPEIVSVSRKVNELIPLEIANEIDEYITAKGKFKDRIKIFIIGFAFKGSPETSDTRGSTTLDLLAGLRNKGFMDDTFFGYDPIVMKEEIQSFYVTPVGLKEGFKDADIVIVMNNHTSYSRINIYELLDSAEQNCLFVDGWHIFKSEEIESINNITYLGVGCKGLTKIN
jgi:UDP-N-acetyl-D-mannosaminuronic acid dehydrogenase